MLPNPKRRAPLRALILRSGPAAALAALLACDADTHGDPGGADVGDVSGSDAPRACEDADRDRIGTLQLGGGFVDEQSGVVAWVPLSDGDEVDIVPGWQGGQHVWLILRATGAATCFVEPRFTITDERPDPVLQGRFGGQFYPLPDDPGLSEFPAYAAFIADPARVHRHEVTIQVEVSDGRGHLMTASVRVIPVDPRIEAAP